MVRAHKELVVFRVIRDPVVQWVPLDPPVHKADLVIRDHKESRYPEPLEQLGLLELRVMLDNKDLGDLLDHKVRLVNEDSRELPDQLDNKDHGDSLENKDLRDKLVVLDKWEVKVCIMSVVSKDRVDSKDLLVISVIC